MNLQSVKIELGQNWADAIGYWQGVLQYRGWDPDYAGEVLTMAVEIAFGRCQANGKANPKSYLRQAINWAATEINRQRLGLSVSAGTLCNRKYVTSEFEASSLQATVADDDGDSIEVGDLYADPQQDTASNMAESSERVTMLREAMEHLPERERNILSARWIQEQTLAETGAQYGLTAEGVRQIEKRAMAHVRELIPA